MRYITPRVIVDRYFCEPHFNRGEIVAFRHFPGSLMRTLIFMASCFNCRYRKGRQLVNYLSVAPFWYQKVSKYLSVLMLGHFAFWFGLMMLLHLWGVIEDYGGF